MLLKDKVALITGGGNGIGRAIVLRFLQDGAKVVTVDLDQAGLEETLKEAGQADGAAPSESKGRVRGEMANITKREDVQRVVDSIVKEHGRLDILINNAGITRDALTARVKDGEVKLMTDEQWDAVLEVNLKGTWLCSQIAAVEMIKQKYGRIVSTASVAAIGHMGQSNYAASKAGVVAVTQTLALELARFNIAVNCIAPGGTKTRMTAAIPENIMANLIERIPLKRFADPREIAAVHAFLASDEASFITGQCIFVDGGQTVGA